MDGILELCTIIGGLLIVLGIGGAACDLVCRLPILKRMLDRWFGSLPMGRDEVRQLSRGAKGDHQERRCIPMGRIHSHLAEITNKWRNTSGKTG